jgi:gliding motility-associated-like protein
MKQIVSLMNRRLFLTLFFPLFLCYSNVFGQNGFFLQDSLILKLNNCVGKTKLCFESIIPSAIQNFQLQQDNVILPAPYTTCKSDTIYEYTINNALEPALAPFRIDSVTIGTIKYKNVVFSSAKALTDSLNKWDPVAKWNYDDQTKRITGTPKLKYSAIAYTVVNSSLPNTIGLNFRIVPAGLELSFERGTHKLVASGNIPVQKDSIYIIVACSKTTISTKEITIDENLILCADASSLPAKRIISVSPITSLSSNIIEYKVQPGDTCFALKGKNVGKDTLIYISRGLGGINDTNIVYINVKAARKIGKHEVTQFVEETKTSTYCIDINALIGIGDTIVSVTNYCAASSGKDAKFTIAAKDNCIKIEGLKAGAVDTACIVIENQKAQKDTTIIYARVIKSCDSIIKPRLIVNNIADCLLEGEICFPKFRVTDTIKYDFFADGNLYKGETALCDFQDISGISYQNMIDSATNKVLPFPYEIISWGINGQKFMNGGIVNSLQEIVDQLNKWNPAGNWKLDTLNRYFRGGDKKNTYDNLYLENQVVFTQHFAKFNFGTTSNGVAFYFKKGVREILIVDKTTGCTDSVTAVVHCAKTNIINTVIYNNQKDTFCLDLSSLVGKNITITNNAKDANNVTFTPSTDKKCTYFTGKKIGLDTLILVACDEFKACDTTFLFVEVIPRSNNEIVFDTINVNGSGKFCLDTLFATGKIKSIVNTSIQSGTSVVFKIDNKQYCIEYTGTSVIGTDTAVVIICDENDICDTTTIFVTTRTKPATDGIVRDTIGVNTTFIYCLPKDKFDLPLTSPLTVKNVCEKTTNKDVTFTIQQTSQCNGANNFGYALIYTGVRVGTDTACIEVADASGKKDTLRVLVTVVPKKVIAAYRDTVLIGTTDTYCIPTNNLNLLGTIDTAFNACPTSSGKDVKFTIIKSTSCQSGYAIRYEGIKANGTDTACVVVRDRFGNTDTLPAIIYVRPLQQQPKLIFDTVFIYQTKRYCIDTAQLKLTGGIDSIWNICPSGINVTFTIDKNTPCTTVNGTPGLSIFYTGGEVGVDTACFVIADDIGKLDTIRFIVTVKAPTPSFISDKVEIGKTLTICADTTQLFGKIVSVRNICPTLSGSEAKFTIDTLTKCVRVEGLKIGKDTACIVVCDEFDVCDTTTIYIEVVPIGAATITAIDDTASTKYPTAVVIRVLANDVFDIKDTATIEVRIVQGKEPKHGIAVVDTKTKTIQYVPDPNTKYCGQDTFFYYIRVGTRTDTARVVVEIKCDSTNTGPFKVYNGFSPNDDGKNDTFVIDGLDNFPDNELIIYNRWGNQVFRKKNYDNTWNGTWEGSNLPDGTYYYILCLPDGNATKIESGYLELRR